MKKEMDLKRYERVAGREALKQMLDGKHAYFISLSGGITSFFFDNNDQLKGETETGEIFEPEVTVTKIIEHYNWYIKKPFDVRAEMLARPNEWVGAYRANEMWWKVALRLDRMEVVSTSFKSTQAPHETHVSEYVPFFDRCIPIEDVPEEELT